MMIVVAFVYKRGVRSPNLVGISDFLLIEGAGIIDHLMLFASDGFLYL